MSHNEFRPNYPNRVDPAERDAIELVGHLQPHRFHAVRSYHGIRAAALSPSDPLKALYSPLDWQCRELLTGHADDSVWLEFGRFLSVEDQWDWWRWFLILCAEILYGDNYCPDLAAEIETNPPEARNRTHVPALDTMDEIAAYGKER